VAKPAGAKENSPVYAKLGEAGPVRYSHRLDHRNVSGQKCTHLAYWPRRIGICQNIAALPRIAY